MIARERDLAASERDCAAEARDREADARDAEVARLTAIMGQDHETTGLYVVLRAATDRAAAQRANAARDRKQAARDRELAAEDRANAAVELEATTVDALTGAWRRGPGLGELQREIDRARREETPLVIAYVDVDGLKATNDSEGHGAGDELLRRVVGTLRSRLRSYEPIIRLGGDEFLCTMSGATIENAWRRFADITSALAAAPLGGSITVGFAQLAPGDSPADVISRADADLLSARRQRRHLAHPSRPSS